MDHDHQRWVLLEDVVREWDDHDDCRRWCVERQSSKSLHERGQQIRGKHATSSNQSTGRECVQVIDLRGIQEELRETEESCAVLEMQDIAIQECVQPRVK